jgi:D-glycero-alpha-D-manno-heptose 1-phosphate guanylyltransferase
MTYSSPREMLILAGGFGTRLRSIVNEVPKPMAPVSGRPFLEFLLDYWIDQGVSHFVLSVGHKGNLIKDHFGTSYKNAAVSYVHETTSLGTGGAIKYALEMIKWSSDYILLANGDTWFEADLSKLVNATRQLGKPVTIVLTHIEKNDRYGGVTIDEGGLVTAFGVEKKKNCLINVGCYLLDRHEFYDVCSAYPPKFSFEENFLIPLATKNLVASSVQKFPFLDIGIPADYHKASDIVGPYKFKGIKI